MIAIQCTIQIAYQIMEKLNQLDFARPLTSETMLTVESGSFRPGSFRPNLGVGRFGLGRWVDSALGRFGPGSFRPMIDR